MAHIDHTGHGHDATTKARTACRKLRSGARVADMVQVHITTVDLAWGVVLGFTPAGELKVRLRNQAMIYVPANEIVALERKA
jgi:hypothetical protein